MVLAEFRSAFLPERGAVAGGLGLHSVSGQPGNYKVYLDSLPSSLRSFINAQRRLLFSPVCASHRPPIDTFLLYLFSFMRGGSCAGLDYTVTPRVCVTTFFHTATKGLKHVIFALLHSQSLQAQAEAST